MTTRTKHLKSRRPLWLTLVLGLFLAVPVLAEDGGPPTEEEPEERGKMMKKIQMMRMYALTEALDLDELRAAKLFPYLRDHDKTLMGLHDEKRKHHKALKTMLRNDAVDGPTVDSLILALGKVEIELARANAARLQGLRPILTAEQRARFVLVSARFERQVKEMIKEHRHRRRSKREGRREGHRGQGHPDDNRGADGLD